MELFEVKGVLEALLFISPESLSVNTMREVLDQVEEEMIRAALIELAEEYRSRPGGLQIVEVAGGWAMVTRQEVAPWVKRLAWVRQRSRLSKAAVEALAMIAYSRRDQKPGLTRAEIELIRGTDSAGVLKTLLDRRLIKIVGRKEVPGRPMLYGVTQYFLEYFGLTSLFALPPLKDFEELLREAEGERSGQEDIPAEQTNGF